MIVYDDDDACMYALTIDVPYANTVSISILNHEQRPQAFLVLVQAFLDVDDVVSFLPANTYA